MSRIITFYSYKGGVGRTFALANIAVLLAKRGKRVLLMDWDLEAPGLHRYFKGYLEHNAPAQEGLIHLLGKAEARSEAAWQSNVMKIVIPECEPVDLIASGDQASDYVQRVRNFSWNAFFEEHGGGELLNRWRNEWKARYDFVLVDSRTGITDTGGVCTIYLPDILVLVFSANEQSFERGVQVASGVQKARRDLAVPRPPLAVLPLPGRFDGRDEVDEAQFWLNRFAEELKPFYDDWLPKGLNPRQILELTKVPYITKFSFGEPLPVITQGTSDPEFPGFYLENIARLLSSDFADAQAILSGGPSGIEASISDFRAQLAQVPIDEGLLTQTLASIEEGLGSGSQLSDLLREAGIALLRQSRFDASESCLRRSLALTEEIFGSNHPSTVSGLIHLAELLETTKRLSEAEALYRRTLEVLEETHTVEEGVVATVYDRLAGVLRESGRIEEAEVLYRRSLELLEMTSTGGPVVANSYNNLGTIYRETGRWIEAETMYRRALELLERDARPSDPAIVDAYSNLASVLRRTRRLDEAEMMYRRALEMIDSSSSAGGSAVTNVYTQLASLYRETGRLDEAEHLYRRMLETLESTARRGDPVVNMAYTQLASLYRETGRLDEAERLYRRMLETVELTARRGDPAISIAYTQLASLYRETGRLDETEHLYRRMLEMLESSGRRGDPATSVAYIQLASLYRETERLDEAEHLYRRMLETSARRGDSAAVSMACTQLASLYRETGRLDEAEHLYRRNLETLEVTSSRRSPAFGIALNRLAEVLTVGQRFSEAEPLLRRALEVFEANSDRDNPEAVKARELLARILEARNEIGEAKSLRSRASFDTFISHDARDKRIVLQLVRELENRRIRVWFDLNELVPGRPWREEIEKALTNVASMIVCIGEKGVSRAQEKEIEWMRGPRSSHPDRPIIPVILAGSDIPSKLPLNLVGVQWLDLREGLDNRVLDRLEWAITGRRPRSDRAELRGR